MRHKNYGKYTEEMIEWLKAHHNVMKLDDLTKTFNDVFGTTFTKSAICHKKNRVIENQVYRTTSYIPRVRWTKELIEALKENYDKYSYKQLSVIINERFNVKTTQSSVEHKVNRLGLKKTPEGIKKTWNSKVLSKFWFQPGHTSTRKPIGSEIIDRDYVWVKYADPDKWRQKHRLIWEQHYGRPIPQGHKLIFLDGNRQNCDIDNLELVTGGELGTLNVNKMLSKSKDLNQTALLIAKLIIKAKKKRKEVQDGNKK